ncbi:membrane protein [Halohasta litchfieldiae]|jgi:membrane protein|uniref:Membrane protein n=1 Tax=Halohasta litchfieldiae TaxID=1073996 RepID=A0A1H6W6D5_9EURY|nr:YihY/virulence factor BrkB family protein [Halohasta litchfieldiae]ATW87069.1 membrane protein [Halohasta litchfieldiae]SEJ12463.1 membrane protein [Halohasta litchfieldiae]
MPSVSQSISFGKRVKTEFSEKNVTFMAGGIAYNALVSLAPLLILLVLAVSFVGGGLEDRLVSAAEESLPGPIADVVTQIFTAGAATGVSVIGLIVLIWGTLKVFRGLDTAFSEIYETEDDNSFVDQIVDGLVVLVALVIAIIATIVATTVFGIFADTIPYIGVLTPLVLIAGLVVAFFPIYYRFPDADLGWRDVLPGVVFAAVGWAALQGLFQLYLAFTSGSDSVFGGVIVVITWLYFSGLVLLLGAVLNAVVGGHSSGAAGGVGSAATGAERPVDATELDRAELASYLRELRQQLTGEYEEMEPEAMVWAERQPENNVEIQDRDGTLRKYRPITTPDDTVSVIEHTSHTDGREQSVTIRWRTPDDEADS